MKIHSCRYDSIQAYAQVTEIINLNNNENLDLINSLSIRLNSCVFCDYFELNLNRTCKIKLYLFVRTCINLFNNRTECIS